MAHQLHSKGVFGAISRERKGRRGLFKSLRLLYNLPPVKLFLFLLTNFILKTADIVSDVLAAADFFSRGHLSWGLFTCLIILAPFAAKVLLAVFNLLESYFEKNLDGKLEKKSPQFQHQVKALPKLILDFPMLQPIKFARHFFALLFIDSSLDVNYPVIYKIKLEMLRAGTLETFVESAPQLIFQCSIIYRTGNTSKLEFLG